MSKVRRTNRWKVSLCYLACFAVPWGWLFCALRFVYPYRLAGSAPMIAQNLISALPFLGAALAPAAALAADPAAASAQAWADALGARDLQWMLFLVVLLAAAWLITLLCQLLWRVSHARPVDAARNARRAIRDYRLMMALVWLVNLAACAALWLLGARFIPSRAAWDYLAYFVPYALNVLAAFGCFRLAAPPVLSGKHAFFKRL